MHAVCFKNENAWARKGKRRKHVEKLEGKGKQVARGGGRGCVCVCGKLPAVVCV